MKTICCKCKVLIKDDGKPDGQISHGFCLSCGEIENKKLDKLIAEQNRKEKLQ